MSRQDVRTSQVLIFSNLYTPNYLFLHYKGVEKYSRKPDSQLSASWISSFFSSVNRLPLLDVSTHPLFFGLSGPLGGQSLLYFGEQSAKIGNDDR